MEAHNYNTNKRVYVCKQVRLINVCQRFVIGLNISEIQLFRRFKIVQRHPKMQVVPNIHKLSLTHVNTQLFTQTIIRYFLVQQQTFLCNNRNKHIYAVHYNIPNQYIRIISSPQVTTILAKNNRPRYQSRNQLHFDRLTLNRKRHPASEMF